MAQTVTGRIMPIIAVPSVDATRNFYVDTLSFHHVMGMIGKDGQLDFCTGRARRGPHDVFARPERQPNASRQAAG